VAEAFDPYHKWLGIPPKDQPPNHYRLLGIERFESDPQVIELAADRQMTHVRTFQTGPNSALSQRLLNELSAARLCLLNAQRKTEYDRTLQAAAPQPAAAQQVAPQKPAPQSPTKPQPALRQQPTFPQAMPAATFPMAEPASSGTIPLAAIAPAPTQNPARPQMRPAPLGGGLPPALPPSIRPRKSNGALTAVVAIAAIVVVGGAIMTVLIMQLRARTLAERETARQEPPQPTNNKVVPSTPPKKSQKMPGTPVVPPVAVVAPSVRFTNARRSMAQRDLDAAERELVAAQPACFTINDRQECARLEQVLALLRAFWSSVQDGWNSLQAGEQLQVANDLFVVVKVDLGSLVLRSAGIESTYTMSSLTGDLAVLLASRHLDATSPSIFLCLGAFHAMDRAGDREQAPVMWNQATNAGLNLTSLLPELNRPQ
jgi:hypothetical protein